MPSIVGYLAACQQGQGKTDAGSNSGRLDRSAPDRFGKPIQLLLCDMLGLACGPSELLAGSASHR